MGKNKEEIRWLEAENKTQKAFPRLQGKRKKKQDNVPVVRKRIKSLMIGLVALLLSIPTEKLTEEEIEIAATLVKSKTIQKVWEKTKKK